MNNLELSLRFLSKIKQVGSCWEWQTERNKQGYGRFWDGSHKVSAHRFSYELFRYDIPEGLVIDHLCRNPICVNPSHLEIVTNDENIKRGLTGKIHHRNTRKTHCSRGHKLKEPNLDPYELKHGRRSCKICKNMILATKFRRKKGVPTRDEWLDKRFGRRNLLQDVGRRSAFILQTKPQPLRKS